MKIYPLEDLKIAILNRQIALQWSRCSEHASCICVGVIDESTQRRGIICKKKGNYAERVDIPSGHYSVWRMKVIAFASDTWVEDTMANEQSFWEMLLEQLVGSRNFIIGAGSIQYHVKVTPLKGQGPMGMDQVALTVKTNSTWGPGVLEYGYDNQRFPLPGIENHGKTKYPPFLVPKGAFPELFTRDTPNSIEIERHQGLFFW